MRLVVLAILIALSPGCRPAPPGAEPGAPAPRPVKFASGDGKGLGELFVPTQGQGPFPPVVLLHGDYGITDAVRGHAARLAGRGHLCLVVDLYRGEKVDRLIDAHILDRGLPEDRALADIRGALSFLQARDDCAPGKIAVVGWGMGGGLALDAALADRRITAVVTCDGRLTTDAAALRSLGASVLGIYAEKDEGTPPETLAAFRRAMTRAGKRLAGLHVLAGCDRDFMLPAPGAAMAPRDREAAEEAWRFIDDYLRAELR